MILYFSGTGNSRHAANLIGAVTGDEVVSMNERIKQGGDAVLASERPFVFVTPTHAWRIPHVVEQFLRKTRFEGSRQAYFVMTCGFGTGDAARYLKKLCRDKGLEYRGLASIVMPHNYVLLFRTPAEAEAEAIVRRAEPRITAAADRIRDGKPLPEEGASVVGMAESVVFNPIFRALFISARGFYATDACTSCGVCEELCPVNNIRLSDGKPQWGKECVHCMACIGGCPEGAVEYGSRTKGKRKYYWTEKTPV